MLTAVDNFLVSNIVGVSQSKPSVDIEMSDEQFWKLLVEIDAWVHNFFGLFLDECGQPTPDCPAGVKVTVKNLIYVLAVDKRGTDRQKSFRAILSHLLVFERRVSTTCRAGLPICSMISRTKVISSSVGTGKKPMFQKQSSKVAHWRSLPCHSIVTSWESYKRPHWVVWFLLGP